MIFSRIAIIFRKELVDNLRDRRSVLSALITPLFMPIFLVSVIVIVGRSVIVGPSQDQLVLPVVGAGNAPNLVQYLRQNGITVQEVAGYTGEEVRQGEAPMVLVIPPSYTSEFQGGLPADLQIVVDSSRQSSTHMVARVRSLLASYSQQVTQLRLLARGINPTILTPINIAGTDVATPQSQTLIFLNMLPFLIVVVIFIGGMYVIIDTTAGERERGTLEPLLINPATREEFVLGKLLASLPFAVGTLLICLAGFWAAFNLVPVEKFTGFPVSIAFHTLLSIFLISIPMILLASGLQIVVATFTRSFKEAQTYLALLPLVAGLPGAFLTFLPVKATLSTMFIPAFSQSLLINQAMRGEAISPLFSLLSTLTTLAASLVLIWFAIRLYQSERVVIGR